ncbi:carbohydrate kinase family protein [Desulfovibrio sp. OttesenSCG-928-I05]|nr:carbohydrate kinase family protein [Desulfovibrio sp. OttesenSCG-928-I05]
MNIYVTGSIAYDRIMNFSGKFEDHILPNKIHSLNVSFFIERLDEHLGGCGGNIVWTLACLGTPSTLVGAGGRDFDRYRASLEALGLPMDGVSIFPEELTAGAYIITDLANNQITGFNAGAMRLPSTYTFPSLTAEDIGIVSPTNPGDMQAHPRRFKEKGARYIFDPGQQIPVLSAEVLLEAIAGSFILISNDYELEMICNTTGKTRAEIRALTQNIITTLGEQGSTLDCAEGQIHIPAVPVSAVVDPTGAGDAYRSGLLHGLAKGLPLADCARLGSTASSFCIENAGTQAVFTKEAFDARHAANFG